MSTTNVTNKVRISADVRWQPKNEPADPRYVGDVQKYLDEMSVAGAWSTAEEEVAQRGPSDVLAEKKNAGGCSGEPEKVTIGELRGKWGFPVPEGREIK